MKSLEQLTWDDHLGDDLEEDRWEITTPLHFICPCCDAKTLPEALAEGFPTTEEIEAELRHVEGDEESEEQA